MIHHLKIKPEYFKAVIDGSKPFEIRYNDRNFQKGDWVILEEYEGKKKYGICPDIDTCERYAYIYDEEVKNCSLNRKCCYDYEEDIYTGRRCRIRIKDIFCLDNASKDLIGYVAFTFEIRSITIKKQ